MQPRDLRNPDNKEFMSELFGALVQDGRAYYPDIHLKYKLAHGNDWGWFVRPSFVVIDRRIKEATKEKILEIGDGVLQPSLYQDSSLIARLLQLCGYPREEPRNLDRLGYYNPLYFAKGSLAQTVLENRGYRYLLDEAI